MTRPNTLERLIRSIKSIVDTPGAEMSLSGGLAHERFWRVEDRQDFELRGVGIKRLFPQFMKIVRHHGKEIISIVH